MINSRGSHKVRPSVTLAIVLALAIGWNAPASAQPVGTTLAASVSAAASDIGWVGPFEVAANGYLLSENPGQPEFVMAQIPVVRSQEVSWIRQFGTSGFDAAGDIAADSNRAYVTGRVGFDQALPGQVSAGGWDAFVRMYDAAGSEVWTRQFGTSGGDGFLMKIATYHESLYVAGLTDGAFPGQSSAGGIDMFIRQYDADGNEGWTQQLGTSGDEGVLGIAGHTTGLYVFGATPGVFPGQTSAGGRDFFLAKLDFEGSPLWVRQFGTSANDPAGFFLGGIAADDTGVYVGSTVAAALPGQSSVGDRDAFLRKYDFAGNELWTTQFGTACRDSLSGVAAHSNGVYVAGSTIGRIADPFFPRCTNPPTPNNNYGDITTAFVQKRTANGDVVWTQQYESSSGYTGFSLAIDLAVDDTGVFVTSESIRPRDPDALDPACPVGAPKEDIHLRAYDLGGKELWTLQIGSTELDVPQGLAVNGTGIYVAGVTFCQLAGQVSAGGADALVVRVASTP